MTAVIVDIKGKYAAALDEHGSIVKIPNANYTIGQEIELHPLSQKRAPSLRRIGTSAAAAALILAIGTGTACAAPYGTVTLEADSAIEYTINRFDRVLSVKALNEEGETVLETLDQDSLRFRPVDQAIAATLEQIAPVEEADNVEAQERRPIQITAVTRDEQHTERLQEHLNDRIPERPASIHPAFLPETSYGKYPSEEPGSDAAQWENTPVHVGETSLVFSPDGPENGGILQEAGPSGREGNLNPDSLGGEMPPAPPADNLSSEPSTVRDSIDQSENQLLPPGGDFSAGPSADFHEPGNGVSTPPHGSAGGPAPGGLPPAP